MFRRANPTVTPAPTPASRTVDTPELRRRQNEDNKTLYYPLTTVWTPNPTCAVPTLYASDGQTFWQTLGTESDVETLYRPGGSSCYPDQFFKARNDGYTAFYSPGVCPSGWAVVDSTGVAGSDATQARCCVVGGTVDRDGSCARSTLYSLRVDISGSISMTTGQFVIVEPALTIGWASSDLENFVPPSAPILPAAVIATATATGEPTVSSAGASSENTQAATSTASQNTSPSSSSVAQNGDGGLSTGAKAGIGVGVAIAALLAIGLAAWLLLRRKRQKRQSAAHTQSAPGPGWSGNEPSAYQEMGDAQTPLRKYEDKPPLEMSSQERYELDSPKRRAELQGS